MKVSTKEAYELMHDGAKALAQVEHNGIRIDTEYLDRAIESTNKEILTIQAKLKNDKIYKVWRKTFIDRTRLGSREQLAKVLFDVLKHPYPGGDDNRTSTGRYRSDGSILESIKHPFVKDFIRVEKLKKSKTTYLEGIRKEVVNGFLHPVFNLHTVRTFRSSGSSPNFTNFPIRDPEYAKLIRTAFLPRENRLFVETDYSGIEVKIAACYHKDPVMLEYINDPTKDMHRDMAMECYLISPKEWKLIDPKQAKQIRYCAKNMYVFPQFYGSYYIDCTKALWEALDNLDLKGPNNISLKEHLASKGIKTRGACNPESKPKKGTLEYHIQQVERDFWGKRFKVYAEWKDKWYAKYLREGGFSSLTGFRENGLYKKNDVINHPVQGAAFHCLLWSTIQMQKYITKRKMKSLLIGEIHDSVVSDVTKSEIQEYLTVLKRIMTQDIRNHWKWLIVPLDIEVEISESNWYAKKLWKETDGVWELVI